MWVLLIIITMSNGDQRVNKLNQYPTYEECNVERERVQGSMERSYPDDKDFLITCRYKEKVVKN